MTSPWLRERFIRTLCYDWKHDRILNDIHVHNSRQKMQKLSRPINGTDMIDLKAREEFTFDQIFNTIWFQVPVALVHFICIATSNFAVTWLQPITDTGQDFHGLYHGQHNLNVEIKFVLSDAYRTNFVSKMIPRISAAGESSELHSEWSNVSTRSVFVLTIIPDISPVSQTFAICEFRKASLFSSTMTFRWSTILRHEAHVDA